MRAAKYKVLGKMDTSFCSFPIEGSYVKEVIEKLKG
jgi:hypothetical protein